MAIIFVVEDNESLREAIAAYLMLDDHTVVEFSGVAGVADAVKARNPDLLVLDVMLPDGDGFQLAKRIRSATEVPILFLTARTSESDRITGFELGGDDYVVKPFSAKELVLRINAILRRSQKVVPEHLQNIRSFVLKDAVMKIDESTHQTTIDELQISLTATEWKLLQQLSSRAGYVVTRENLMESALDYLIPEGSERTIDTHIKNLRVKLGKEQWIETVRGFGYRFAGKVK